MCRNEIPKAAKQEGKYISTILIYIVASYNIAIFAAYAFFSVASRLAAA